VSAPSKNIGFSMSMYHASKELKVQLIGGQQNIDACSVRCCGTRCPHIKPVKNLADQSASIIIKTSSTEHTSNLKQFPVSSLDFKSIEGILEVDSLDEGVPSLERLLEPFLVHILEKIRTGNVEPIWNSASNRIKNRVNVSH